MIKFSWLIGIFKLCFFSLVGICGDSVFAEAEDLVNPGNYVPFQVEVPSCTPREDSIYLYSNRLKFDQFTIDPLLKVEDPKIDRNDAKTYTGTFQIDTPISSFRYKYLHSPKGVPPSLEGREVALTFTGNPPEGNPGEDGRDRNDDSFFFRRLLPASTFSETRNPEVVALWQDSLYIYGNGTKRLRTIDEKVAFCQPYLSVSSTSGQMTLSYDSYYAKPLTLEYWPIDKATLRQFSIIKTTLKTKGGYRNHFKLTGLASQKVYNYKLFEGESENNTSTKKDSKILVAQSQFLSPPVYSAMGVFNPIKTIRFALIGDTQYSEMQNLVDHRKAVERIREFSPSLIIGVGDLVSSTYSQEKGFLPPEMGRWSIFAGAMQPLLRSIPFNTAMGNHEEDGDYYWSVFDFPKPHAPMIDHYWFQFGSAQFIVLYTGKTQGYNVEGIVKTQGPWMEKVLKDSQLNPTIRWRFVVMHRGPFSQGSFHPDDGFWFSEKRIYPGGPTWRNLWEKYKIDAVMAGHNHNFTLAEKMESNISLCAVALPRRVLIPNLCQQLSTPNPPVELASLKSHQYSFGFRFNA